MYLPSKEYEAFFPFESTSSVCPPEISSETNGKVTGRSVSRAKREEIICPYI